MREVFALVDVVLARLSLPVVRTLADKPAVGVGASAAVLARVRGAVVPIEHAHNGR